MGRPELQVQILAELADLKQLQGETNALLEQLRREVREIRDRLPEHDGGVKLDRKAMASEKVTSTKQIVDDLAVALSGKISARNLAGRIAQKADLSPRHVRRLLSRK